MTIERRSSVVALALVASFMVFVDGTIVNLALAQLTSHLDASRPERRLDLAGMTMATLLIGGAVFAFVEAPARGWTDPAVLAAGAFAGTGAVGFTLAERHAAAPVLPVTLYAHRGFVTTLAQGALFNFTFYGLLFALGLLLQVGRGMSALTSGLLFLPLTGLISVGSLCAAWLGRRLGRRVLLALGQGIITLSLLAVAWAAGGTQLWPLALALAPAGLCAGMLVPSMTAQALADVDTALHGAASAVFNTARQLGGAVGVAVFGPLLGTADALGHGFRVVVVVGAAATALALGLNGRTPSRAQRRAPSVHAA